MSQVIKYQTTEVDPLKSAGEISHACRKYGASRFEMRWNEKGQLAAVRFSLRHPKFGEVPVFLEAKIDTIYKLLRARTQLSNERAQDQAYRIAWRQLKDFVEAALFAVETGLFAIHEAFFSRIETVDPETGQTVVMSELIERHGAHLPGGAIALIPARAGRPVPPTIEAEVEFDG